MTSQHVTTVQHDDLRKPAEQPTGSDLRFATISLSTGVRLHYAEQGDPNGGTIVFLHGYTDSWYSFSRLLPLLEPARYHVYAISQRGHGDSDRPDGGYTIDDFAADVAAFLDAVSATRVNLVGHSMGSMVARRVAETYPERVAQLVIIGSFLTPIHTKKTRELLA